MRISLNNIRLADDYIHGKLMPADRLLFEARLLLSPVLRFEVAAQKKVTLLVKMYHRKKMKEELAEIHRRIFSDPANIVFKTNIEQIFNTRRK